MAEKRGMPPWSFLVATIVALLMVVMYVQAAIDEGFSLWMLVRIGVWAVFAVALFYGFNRARRARRDGSRFIV